MQHGPLGVVAERDALEASRGPGPAAARARRVRRGSPPARRSPGRSARRTRSRAAPGRSTCRAARSGKIEHREVEVEANEARRRDSEPLRDHAPADEQHRRLREQRQEAEHRHVERALPIRLHALARTRPRSGARTSPARPPPARTTSRRGRRRCSPRRRSRRPPSSAGRRAGADATRGCSGMRPRSGSGAIASAISASFHEIRKTTIADADDREDVLEEEDQPVAEEEADALQVDRRAATSAARSGGGRRSRTRAGRASRRSPCACPARRRAPACPAISRRPAIISAPCRRRARGSAAMSHGISLRSFVVERIDDRAASGRRRSEPRPASRSRARPRRAVDSL